VGGKSQAERECVCVGEGLKVERHARGVRDFRVKKKGVGLRYVYVVWGVEEGVSCVGLY